MMMKNKSKRVEKMQKSIIVHLVEMQELITETKDLKKRVKKVANKVMVNLVKMKVKMMMKLLKEEVNQEEEEEAREQLQPTPEGLVKEDVLQRIRSQM